MSRKTTSRPSRRTVKKQPSLQREVINLSLAAVGILLLLAMVGTLGLAGTFVRNFLFGFFGMGAFFLPVAILAFAVLRLAAREIELPLIKILALNWLVLSLLHIFVFTRHDGNVFADVYRAGIDSGGGIMGLLLGGPAQTFLGTLGATIAIVSAMIILLILITKRSFIQFLSKGMEKARDYYEETQAYEEEYARKQEEETLPAHGFGFRKKEPPKPDSTKPKKSNIIEINAPTGDEPPPRIMLVAEELGDKYKAKVAANPLFAPRPPIIEPDPTPSDTRNPAIVNFPDIINRGHNYEGTHSLEAVRTAHSENRGHNYEGEHSLEAGYRGEGYDDEPSLEAGYREEGYAGETSPESDSDDGFTPEEYAIFDEHLAAEQDDSRWRNSTDSPEEENDFLPGEEIILPVDPHYESYGNGPVVKGLVDGAETSDEPIFDDSPHFEDESAPVAAITRPASSQFSPQVHNFENYQLPHLDLLAKNERPAMSAESRTHVLENSRILEETLRSFKIEAKVVEVSVGPTVTRYDLAPGSGVKVSSITNLSNDLALSLAAQGLRIEAPVPGKSAIGIEIPNKESQGVFLRDIFEDERFSNFQSKLAFAVGKDIAGSPVVTDIARMPHLLIAGATGSGKSVCINTLIASLLYKARPDEVKLLMIDPKVVELSVYNGIPHLLIPVVTDPKKASGALAWAVAEMETRYGMFAESGCRDLKGYNKYAEEQDTQTLPQIVIIIDELADLMMSCKGEVEESICRLAQKARACGIHLIVATQRPSVDVITGLIKANIPSRLAFAVSSGTDSRTVLDMYGAEKLLGRGDMLFLPMGQNKPLRVQGGFISDKEVENLVAFLKAQAPVVHSVEEIQAVTMPGKMKIEGEVDEFFHDAVEFLLAKGKGSTSMLQRQFRIGYNRASRLMDDLQKRGIVGPEDGVKPRKVTITRDEYRELYGNES